MGSIRHRAKIFTLGMALTFAGLLGCSGDTVSETATVTSRHIDDYLATSLPHVNLVTDTDNAVTAALVQLREQELAPDPNSSRRTQLQAIRVDGGEVRSLDEMSVEEIVAAFEATPTIFIPEDLREEMDRTTSIIEASIAVLDQVSIDWEVIIPPLEAALFHSLQLQYFQSLSRYYTASLDKKTELMQTAEVDPVTQAKLELSLGQLGDSLRAVQSEFRRFSAQYGPR